MPAKRDPRQLDLLPAGSGEAPATPERTRVFRRSDSLLVVLALAGGVLFFASLGRIWPLARADLTVRPAEVERRARSFLAERGRRIDTFDSATRLAVDDAALDYVERTFGRERAQSWIADELPLVSYRASFKKAGDPDAYAVSLHPGGRALGWSRELEEDEPGQRIGAEPARDLARRELDEGLGLDPSEWEEKSVALRELPNRRDHSFTFERTLSESPELRERAVVLVAGHEIASAYRTIVVPGPARREATARAAPGRALMAVGIALLACGAVAAFVVFLRRLMDGTARLGRVGVWICVLAAMQIVTLLLQTARRFAEWETLWPRWVSSLETLVYDTAGQSWLLLVLLALFCAGEALDRESGAGRGASLWALGRGRIADPAVAAASARGFLVGLLCGGVLAASVLGLEALAGARTAIQPRGFFFYALNSASPSMSTVLFFLSVALAEELGYRFFGATFLLSATRSRVVAVLGPAVVYGLTHTTLDFLPPADPFWARPLVLTLVGCVWGWAFLRYDALTVVLSHFTADLFIFNWPRLASGRPAAVASAVAAIAVPLIPAVLWAARRRFQPVNL